MKQRIIVIFFALATLSLFGEIRELTIDEAVELGKAHNLTLKIQDIEVVQAQREKDDRFNVFFPDMSASATLNRSNLENSGYVLTPWGTSTTNAYGTAYEDVLYNDYEYQYSLIGNVSAQLVLTPAIGNGIKALELNLTTKKLEQRKGENELGNNIKKNYYLLVQMTKGTELLEKNISTTTQRYRDMQAMYQNGMIRELDLLQTQLGLSTMESELTSLNNQVKQLKMAFCMDIGLPITDEIVLTDEIMVGETKIFNADYLVNRYMGDNLDLQSFYLSKDSAQNGKSAQVNQSLPQLILGYNYNPIILDPLNSESWEDDPFEDNDSGSFSITLNIPLDDWIPHSTADNKVRKMNDTMSALDLQEKQLTQATEMKIRSFVMSLGASTEKLAVLERSVTLSQKAYDLSWESYRNGRTTATDLSQVEDDLIKAENNLIAEKYTYITSLLDLEYTLNRSLDNE